MGWVGSTSPRAATTVLLLCAKAMLGGAVILASSVAAEESSPPLQGPGDPQPTKLVPMLRGHAMIEEDNDSGMLSLGLLPSTDRNYTQGLRLTVDLPASEYPALAGWLGCTANGNDIIPFVSRGLIVNQSIYTPLVINDPSKNVGDRPFAGWLYAGYQERFACPGDFNASSFSLRFEIDLGVVGPAAWGAEAQTTVHRGLRKITNSLNVPPDPIGWDNQIGAEHNIPIANLSIGGERALLSLSNLLAMTGGENAPFDVQLSGLLDVHLGNAFRNMSAGAQLRLGRMDSGQNFARLGLFKTTNYRTGGTIHGASSATHSEFTWEFYFSWSSRVRFVQYNIFIEGTAGGPGVEQAPVVFDNELSATFRFWSFLLSFSYMMRTPELLNAPPYVSPRPEGIAAHQFTRLGLCFLF